MVPARRFSLPFLATSHYEQGASAGAHVASPAATAGRAPVLAAGGLLWRETPTGRRIALVHRQRHGGDWSLPKGKRHSRESWQDAARREVREETGCDVEMGDFAGSVGYPLDDGTPKIVLFWHMTATGPCTEQRDAEVDRVAWLPAHEALLRLSYARERTLLESTLAFDAPANRSFLQRLTGHDGSLSRLSNALPIFRADLATLVSLLETSGSAPESSRWTDAARHLTDQAAIALRARNATLGWRHLKAADRLLFHALAALPDRSPFLTRARILHREASGKLGGWRKQAMIDLLEQDGALKPDVTPEAVVGAAHLLHEHQDNMYDKLSMLQRQLGVLVVIALLIVAGWITMAPSMTTLHHAGVPITSRSFVVAIVLFGIAGATLSGLLSTITGADGKRIPEQLLETRVTMSRLAMGAMASIAVSTFLVSDLLNIGTLSGGLVLAAAFASGFSERLVGRVVEAVTP